MSRKSAIRGLPKRLLRSFLLALLFVLFTVLGLGSALARLFRRPKPLTSDTVRRILVIRLDLLGDLVMSLPAVDALKAAYPHAEVTVLALPYAGPLLAMAPEVDHVLTYDVNLIRRPREAFRARNWRAFRQLVRTLRDADFDLCLALHGQFACVVAWLSQCRHTYGYRGEGYPLLLASRLPGGRYRLRQHEVLYNLKLAQAAGASVDWQSVKGPRLVVSAVEQRQLKHRLAEFEVNAARPLIVVHPGASNGSAKRWLPEAWAHVIDRLQAELQAAVVVTGTAAEADVVRAVTAGCSSRPIVLAGQTSIPQLGALLKRADLLLSGDSGPAHMAAALGTPQVTIFGPTDPAIYAPFGGKVTILRRDLQCSPCYDATKTAECRFGHLNCMRQLSPDDVYRAALARLGADEPGKRLPQRRERAG